MYENEILEKSSFFQKVHVWPLNERLNYLAWLKNFKKEEDLEIAYKLLNFFMYFSENMVRKMLTSSIELALDKIRNIKGEEIKISNIKFTYMPGETLNVSDSGFLYLRNVRDIYKLDENILFHIKDLVKYLDSNPQENHCVIFLDDFVGSGMQAHTAWNITEFENGIKLSSIFDNSKNIAVFATLMANHIGHKKILEDCKNLNIVTNHVLGEEYNIFSEKCLCWEGNIELYKKGCEMIKRLCVENGGKDFYGFYTHEAMGFKKQGLALAFSHGYPDATSQIFHLESDSWHPLIKK